MLKDRLPLFPFFSGLRNASPSSSEIRFNRVVGAASLTLVLDSPQSRSGRESVSESEFRTICSPPETILLLVPEFAEFCDGFGGCASVLVARIVGGAVIALEGFEAGGGEVLIAAIV